MILNRFGTLGVFLATSCLWLSSCTASKDSARLEQTPTMEEIGGLCEMATSHHHQAFRKPAQDEQARAMRLLSQKTELMFAATEGWDKSARLTSLSENGQNTVHNDVHDFRNALQGLKSAADDHDTARLAANYTALRASYGKLIQQIDMKN